MNEKPENEKNLLYPIRINDDSLKKEVFFNKKNLKQLFNEFEKNPTVNNGDRFINEVQNILNFCKMKINKITNEEDENAT